MSVISQFGQGSSTCRRPTLAELQSIVGVSTIGAQMYTDTDNQIAGTALIIPSCVNTDTGKVYTFIAGSAIQSNFDAGFLILNNSRLICKSAGVAMIVAPSTTQVSRTWYCRDDAKLEAQRVTQTCCTQWFIPTAAQLQNPGYCCRTFWDSFSSTAYWSSTENDAAGACRVSFNTGNASNTNKNGTYCVRAFRCVTY